MFILIPLGGIGERFRTHGYKSPKALVKIFGDPILYYLLSNLNLTGIAFVCIAYGQEYSAYRLEEMLKRDFPAIPFRFVALATQTRGAAETLNIALTALCVEDQPVLALDCDNFYTTDIISMWAGRNAVFCFEDATASTAYSFLDVDAWIIREIREKERISNLACTGAYGFASSNALIAYTQHVLDVGKGELYTSAVVQHVLATVDVAALLVPAEKFHCLGTPLQVKYFYNNYPSVSCISWQDKLPKKRYCFDLDSLLTNGSAKHIDFLKYLKQFGHTIIIQTTKGEGAKAMAKTGKQTFEMLEKFDIPYDEIYFGKPLADVYIDDRALNSCDDLEKGLGFYMDAISPRDFNRIAQTSIEAVTKSSANLSGEIFYYQHVPRELKDLFPVLIEHDDNHTRFVVEKIKGLTLTTLYLSGLLTELTMKSVMQSILRIQATVLPPDESDIYANYATKLTARYAAFDYSPYDPQGDTFRTLVAELRRYETEGAGRRTVIHGDCVMTNILINQHDKIKFIDMRGRQGDVLSIQGDWLYDWAKLYQSLVGYDKILMGKTISESYEARMIRTFEDFFLTHFSAEALANLKIITKSLLYSLLPLHHNEKCTAYYELIHKF
jgi:dTDP-glucose pyrophosphorylase